MNKEVLFAKTLEEVRKTAKEQGNCISEEQVKDAFAELDLSGEQLQMVFDYLLKPVSYTHLTLPTKLEV